MWLLTRLIYLVIGMVWNKNKGNLSFLFLWLKMSLKLENPSEALAQSQNCCFAWDATELAGSHVNEVHIAAPVSTSTEDSAPRKYFTLGVGALSGGATSDYTGHIQETLENVAGTYSGFTGENTQEMLSRMKENITSSVTDRVAVNKCVADRLRESDSVHPGLVQLFCNVHPLDSLSAKAREALKGTGTKGTVFGKDCAAANLIHGLSKMRYKQGKGDPGSFKAFMKHVNVPLSVFKRYVGNRMHIVFHLAGINVLFKEQLLLFLDKYCKDRGGLAKALSKDLRDPTIYGHLQILGLLGKKVTGPWMTCLYPETSTNLAMCVPLQNAVTFMDNLVENPEQLLSTRTDCFGHPLDDTDPVLQSLTNAEFDVATVKSVCEAMVKVMKRQLKIYIDDNFTEEQKMLAATAPTQNMQAERILGMTDAQVRRAPNARIDFVEAKVKAKSSQSLKWLDDHPAEKQEELIRYSISQTRKMTATKKARQRQVEAEIIRKLEMKQRTKDQAERKKLEKRVTELAVKGSVTVEQLEETCPQLPAEAASAALTLLNDPAKAVGTPMMHTFFDEEQGKDIVYRGTILKLKRKKLCTFVVAYQDQGEEVEEATDYDMTRNQLVTDLVCGDLVLL